MLHFLQLFVYIVICLPFAKYSTVPTRIWFELMLQSFVNSNLLVSETEMAAVVQFHEILLLFCNNKNSVKSEFSQQDHFYQLFVYIVIICLPFAKYTLLIWGHWCCKVPPTRISLVSETEMTAEVCLERGTSRGLVLGFSEAKRN